MAKRKHEECEKCGRDTVTKCTSCGKNLCLGHLYSYVDESNIAITRNSPLLCKDCYRERYGSR